MASSALIHKLQADVEIKASPEQFHDIWTNKPHHMQHASTDKIQGCELHEGEWGKVGTIINWSYVHEGKTRVAKDVIEAIDPEKNLITFRVLEGDVLKQYKSFKLTLQASSKGEGSGSIVHWTMEYEKLHDGIEHPEALLQFAKELSEDIDAHLTQAN